MEESSEPSEPPPSTTSMNDDANESNEPDDTKITPVVTGVAAAGSESTTDNTDSDIVDPDSAAAAAAVAAGIGFVPPTNPDITKGSSNNSESATAADTMVQLASSAAAAAETMTATTEHMEVDEEAAPEKDDNSVIPPKNPTDSSSSEEEKAIRISESLNKEALLSDMEFQYVELQNDRDALQRSALEKTKEVEALQKTSSDLKHKVESLEIELEKLRREAAEDRAKKEASVEELRMEGERCDRLAGEGDSLREEISRLTESSKKIATQLSETQTQNTITTSNAAPLRYEVERLRSELDSLTSHSKWLESELTAQNEKNANLKVSHSAALMELKTKVDATEAERDDSLAEIQSRRNAEEKLKSTVERLSLQLRDKALEASESTRAAEEELTAERRLVSLSNEKTDRLQSKYDGLLREMETMQRLAGEAAKETDEKIKNMQEVAAKKMEEIIKKEREESDKKIMALEKRAKKAEEGRKRIEDDLLGSPTPLRRRRKRRSTSRGRSSTSPRALPPSSGGGGAAIGEEEGKDNTEDMATDRSEQEPLSLTDLYERLADAEDELHNERTEKKRLELFLQRVRIDIEEKGPIMRQRQREYEMAVRDREEMKIRLEEALEEAEEARSDADAVEAERRESKREVKDLKRENIDLAMQVQSLLQRQVQSGAGAIAQALTSSASDDIVPFGSIEEMQAQNQRLLNEHRRLTDTVSDLEGKLETDPLRLRLETAEAEVVSLREERSRQETLVAGIVQQRDLYRALVANVDSQSSGGSGGGMGEAATLALTASANSETEERKKQLTDQIAELQANLMSTRNAKVGLEERLARLDSHAADLASSVDRLQNNLSTANAAVARSEADSMYHKEKCARLEEALDAARREMERSGESRKELQSLNAKLHMSLVEARAEAASQEQARKQAEVKLRLAETQAETARSSEARLVSETASLRSEITRQGALLESLQRIEASLSARTAEEEENFKETIEQQSQALKTEREKYTVEIERLQGRISDLEAHTKELEKRKDEAMGEMVKAKDEVLNTKADAQNLRDKCTKMEKELADAKRILDVGEGSAESKLALLTAELDAAREELEITKERTVDYQDMAKANEAALADLTRASDEYKKMKGEEIEKINKQLVAAQKLAKTKADALEDISKDLTLDRDEQEKTVADLQNKISSLNDELISAKKDAESAISRLRSLEEEMKISRADATTAQVRLVSIGFYVRICFYDICANLSSIVSSLLKRHLFYKNNYERELAVHSAARTDLRAQRDKVESEVRLRQTAESELNAMKLEFSGERKSHEESVNKLNDALKGAETRLEESRQQNKLLHSQMEVLAETVKKYQSDRIASVSASKDSEPGVTAGSNSEESVVETMSPGELASLRKTVSELREMVRYLKSDREMFEAQLESARRTAERERAATAVTKRSLDEARAELKLLQSHGENDASEGDNTSSASHEGLKKAEEQLMLLRESNILLREEFERKSSKLTSVEKELVEAKKAVIPVEAKSRELEVDKAALEAEKASLVREVNAWKNRVQSLVTKFNQIDPEEHAQVLERVEAMKKEIESLQAQKDQAERDAASVKALVARLNKEISTFRTSIENTKKTLAKTTAERDALAKRNSSDGSDAAKERDNLKAASQKMEAELSTAKSDLSLANGRVENLMKILRKQKDSVQDLESKLTKSVANEQEAQKSLAKEREVSKELKKEQEAQKGLIEEQKLALAKAQKEAEMKLKKMPPTSTAPTTTPPIDASVTKKEVAVSEAKEVLQVPPGGFKFGPSSSADASASTKKGQLDSTAGADAKSDVEKGTPAEPNPVEIEKPALARDESTRLKQQKENLLREKLMKRKRKAEAALMKKKEEESSVPAVKRAGALTPEPKKVPPVTESQDSAKPDKAVTASLETNTDTAPIVKKEETSKEASTDSKNAFQSTPSGKFPFTAATAGKASIFGSSTGFGGTAASMSGSIFGSAKTPVSMLGAPADPLKTPKDTATAIGGKAPTTPAATVPFGSGGAFLNLMPPGSGASKPLTFGSSTSITLPMPSKTSPSGPQPPTFGIFGASSANPFGGFGAPQEKPKPLFGDFSKKRPPSSQEQSEPIAKQPRTEGTSTGADAEKKS